MLKQKYFSSYQSVTENDFEHTEKDKEYQKYLKRINDIVKKKPEQDSSPSKYLREHRQYHESVTKLAKQQQQQLIESANAILISRIASHKNRKPAKYDHYQLKCDFPRRKQLQRIDSENQGMAERLARRYSHKKKGSQFNEGPQTSVSRQPKKKRVNRMLPKLVSSVSCYSANKAV